MLLACPGEAAMLQMEQLTHEIWLEYLAGRASIEYQAVPFKGDRLDAEVWRNGVNVGNLQVGHLCADGRVRHREHTIIVAFEVCAFLNEPPCGGVICSTSIHFIALTGM
jgi:hypothetical protein